MPDTVFRSRTTLRSQGRHQGLWCPQRTLCCCCSVNCSVVSNSLRLTWTAACQASLFFAISQSLLKLMSIESVMPPNYLILCCPLLLLPSVFPSIMVFSSESTLHIRWSKYWSFNFSIGPSNEYSGLISFRIDGFDLLAVQRTLKRTLAELKKAATYSSRVFHSFQKLYNNQALNINSNISKIKFTISLGITPTPYPDGRSMRWAISL